MRWLRGKRRRDSFFAFLYGLLCLVLGVICQSLLFCGFWAFSLLAAPRSMGAYQPSLAFPLIATGVATVLLVFDGLFSRRDDISNVLFWLMRESIGLGARLLLEGFRSVVRAVGLALLDVPLCAEVLDWLAHRRRGATQLEMRGAFPNLSWAWLKRHLGLVEGVIFLGDDSRVVIVEPLRWRLRALSHAGSRRVPLESAPEPEPAPEPEAEPITEPDQLLPHEILGVSPAASLAEIKSAYRTRIKECHPDRFAELTPALREQAEEWTKALNAAYHTMLNAKR